MYNKASHSEALESAKRIKDVIKHDINIDIFEADCTTPQNTDKKIDIIITDVPYGNLVDWKGEQESGISIMMKQLSKIANPSTILAISMDKHEKVNKLKEIIRWIKPPSSVFLNQYINFFGRLSTVRYITIKAHEVTFNQ